MYENLCDIVSSLEDKLTSIKENTIKEDVLTFVGAYNTGRAEVLGAVINDLRSIIIEWR